MARSRTQSNRKLLNLFSVTILALVFCIAALPAPAAQNPDMLSQPQQNPAPSAQSPAAQPQQPGQANSDAQAPSNPSPDSQTAPQVAPATLTLPAGTMIQVRTAGWLSSDHNKAGDRFTAELQQPLVANGWVVARRGQTAWGEVVVAQKAGRVKGQSELGVQIKQVILVDGEQIPVQSSLVQDKGGTSHGRDAAAIGTTTGVGAAIGAAANGGEGAAVGAGIGAVAGIAGVLLTRGKPTIIPPETLLTFQLQAPLTISTEHSYVAFRPVTQEDYGTQQNDEGRRLRRPGYGYGPGYPPPPPPYYYPYYGYGWGYPVVGVGFGWGWGFRRW
jgi:hypothetical protein